MKLCLALEQLLNAETLKIYSKEVGNPASTQGPTEVMVVFFLRESCPLKEGFWKLSFEGLWWQARPRDLVSSWIKWCDWLCGTHSFQKLRNLPNLRAYTRFENLGCTVLQNSSLTIQTPPHGVVKNRFSFLFQSHTHTSLTVSSSQNNRVLKISTCDS